MANETVAPVKITGAGGGLERFLQTRPVILQFLKFAGIGAINTGLDFIILNLISKYFGITAGSGLGAVNIVSFGLATVQSYFWNKAWAFARTEESVLKTFFKLVAIGALGFLAVVIVLFGSRFGAGVPFYLILLLAFVAGEIGLWSLFGLRTGKLFEKTNFVQFVSVSAIGLLINAGLVAGLSVWLAPLTKSLGNVDIVKNVAKIIATVISLIWNFIGYKLFVFKKTQVMGPPVAK